MKYRLTKLIAAGALLTCSITKSAGQCPGTYVILKMDDVRANSGNMYNAAWQRYADSIRAYGINSGMGMVCEDLTTGTQAFKDSLTSWHNTTYFEVWHHGWDHKRLNYPPLNNNPGEFSGTPYTYQKQHFEDGMTYAQSELGITMRSFGAPYNQTDDTLKIVLEENSDMKVWLYCNDNTYSEMCLVRGSNNLLESSTGVCSYNSFETAWASNVNPYLVLQGHPGSWDNNSFDEFDRVIDTLKARNSCFVLPYEYYQIVNNVNVVYSEDFNEPDSLAIGGAISKVDAEQSCCGELKLEVKSGQTLGMNEALVHAISSPVDISGNTKVFLRVRSTDAYNIRVDLSDGSNATDGVNGQLVNAVPADVNNWTVLEYDFPAVSFSDNGVDSTNISEIHIYPDNGTDNFPGSLYIDYVSIGDVSGSAAQCRTDVDPDPCSSLFEDQLDDGVLSLFGSSLANIDAEESDCGELKMEVKSGFTLNAYQPILYNFPAPIDFTQNPKLVVRVRSATSFPLRFDLHDGSNATNGPNGRVSNTIPADINNWTTLEYNYSSQAFLDNGVDSTAITRLNIQLDAQNANFPGPVYIDFISAGEPSGTGNAIGKTDIDNCTVTGTGHKCDHDIRVFPNPTNGSFNILFDDEGQRMIKIEDSRAVVVHEQETNNSNITINADWSAGLYIVSVTDKLSTHVVRVVKE